jgi:aryl-alcohol dehydrogenase-like predicted oxidoreductase
MGDERTTRRDLMKLGLGAGIALAMARLPRAVAAGGDKPLSTRAIPSSGERLPVVGVGTNRFGETSPEELAARRAVLARLAQLGGKVVDTAPGYGQSEEVIGRLVAEIGNRDKLWIATKVTSDGGAAEGTKMLEESLRRLRTDRLELVQVHNLKGWKVLLPVLREWKARKRIKYVGVTTSREEQYDEMLQIMRSEPLDFIQVNYSVGNRKAAEKILPLAAERKVAVLVNQPFGGRRGPMLAATKGKQLPAWAAEHDATSFAQLFLKYVVSHAAVTAAIPGTTKVAHLEDNLRAARGPMPDAAGRKRIEKLFDGF